MGLIGNVFSTKDIDAALEKGKLGNKLSESAYSQKSMGVDPGFGSSAFAIVITCWEDNEIRILYTEQSAKASFEEMLNKVLSLIQKYGISKDNSCQIFVDGSNPSFIRSLKHQLGERSDYEEEIKYYHTNFKNYDYTQDMLVIPVNFAKKHKEMLAHTKKLMENDGGQIAINRDKLITSLRTAVANESTLDKQATSFNDLLDAFRMALFSITNTSSNRKTFSQVQAFVIC